MQITPEERERIIKEIALKWEKQYSIDQDSGYALEITLASYFHDAIYEALGKLLDQRKD